MNEKIFHDRLFAEANYRYKITLSPKKIEKLFESGVLNGRNAERVIDAQSITKWSENNYRKALMVCDLNAQGVIDHDTLICIIWLAGEKYPIRRVGEAFRKEWRRLQRKLTTGIRTKYFKKSHREILTPRRQSQVIGQMGGVSPILVAANIVPNEELLMAFFDIMRHGDHADTAYADRLKEYLSNHLEKIGIPTFFVRRVIHRLVELCKKLFSNSINNKMNDNKFCLRIRSASQTNTVAFYEARGRLQSFLRFVEFVPRIMPIIFYDRQGNVRERWRNLIGLSQALRQPEWSIGLFISFLNLLLACKEVENGYRYLPDSATDKWIIRKLRLLILGKICLPESLPPPPHQPKLK